MDHHSVSYRGQITRKIFLEICAESQARHPFVGLSLNCWPLSRYANEKHVCRQGSQWNRAARRDKDSGFINTILLSFSILVAFFVRLCHERRFGQRRSKKVKEVEESCVTTRLSLCFPFLVESRII